MLGLISKLFSQFRVYIYAFCAISLLFGLGFTHLWMYQAGKNKVLANQTKLFQERDKKIVQLQKEIEDAKTKTRVVYRDRIKHIIEASRSDTCGSTVAPPSVLQQFER